MQVKKSALCDLLEKLGVDTVRTWDAPKLAKKINEGDGIKRFRDDGLVLALDSEQLYDEIAADQSAGNLIEIEDDELAPEQQATPKPSTNGKPALKKNAAVKKPAAKKSVTKKKVKKEKVLAKKPVAEGVKSTAGGAPSMNDKSLTWRQKLDAWKKTPLVMTERGPGVRRRIVEELRAAGRSDPPKLLTKPELLKILVEHFPERNEKKMWTSVNALVPSRLIHFWGIDVRKAKSTESHLGYYILREAGAPAVVPVKKKANAKKVAPKKPKTKPTKKVAKSK